MELPINKYYIEEIKYRLNDNKSVIFKMNNFILKDVEIIETVDNTKKPKELHDYEPFSCLITEAGMQETLNASIKKEWKEKVRNDLNESIKPAKAIKQVSKTTIEDEDEIARKKLDNARKLISLYVKEHGKAEKERFEDREKSLPIITDPDDEFSKIKTITQLYSDEK